MGSLSLRDLKIGAVLNTASGSCTPESAERMREMLSAHGITPVHMWCGDSDGLAAGFIEAQSHAPDVLIVLGGDGTIRSAAERTYAVGSYLIPLPGGTMNVLPKALYGDYEWERILECILEAPAAKAVSGGRVGAARFFVSALCGAPTLWTNAREALREGALIEAVKHSGTAIGEMFSTKVHYRFNEMHEGDAEAVTVTCPLVSSALDEDRQVFEAAVIDVNDATDVLGLATAVAFGAWREAKNVGIVRTPSVTVSSDRNVPIILDGEPIDVGHEAHIEFVPDAFTVLVPAHEILP